MNNLLIMLDHGSFLKPAIFSGCLMGPPSSLDLFQSLPRRHHGAHRHQGDHLNAQELLFIHPGLQLLLGNTGRAGKVPLNLCTCHFREVQKRDNLSGP